MSILLTDVISFADGSGFLSSTLGLLSTFGSTFGSTLGFWSFDVSTDLFGWVFAGGVGLTGWTGCFGYYLIGLTY